MGLGALLGLASAISFGVCDFVAGISARRLSFWWVTLVSLAMSALGAWMVVAVQGATPSGAAVLWGVAAGGGAATGATALYRGYGHGEMAVAGPLSAVGAAALPAVVGAALGERLPLGGVVGVALALPAIWLMASSRRSGGALRTGVIDGLVSGAGFAVEFVGLERAGSSAGLWPVAVSQSTALVLVAASVLARRPAVGGGRGPFVLSAVAGALSLLATGLYFLASHSGTLTVAAVLASLYPGFTVLLAALALGERPALRQWTGLLLGAVAVTLIVVA